MLLKEGLDTNMGQYYNPYISSYETMCLNIDAANDRSYPGSGNTCYDVSSFNNVGALTSVSFAGSGGTETFVFNGTTSLINLGSTIGGNVTTAWTLESWINPTTTGEGSSGRVFQHSSGSTTGFICSLSGSTSPVNLRLDSYPANTSVTLQSCVTLGSWQQVAWAFSPGSVTFYVNGAAVGTSSITSPSSYTGSDYIGNNSGATNTFNGNIGIVRLYRNTLSAAEIKNNYDAFKGRYSTSGAGGLQEPQ
jgi:hypothetical protein